MQIKYDRVCCHKMDVYQGTRSEMCICEVKIVIEMVTSLRFHKRDVLCIFEMGWFYVNQ